MNSMKDYIIVNRDNSRPLCADVFANKAEYDGYICTVNALRNHVGNLAQLDYKSTEKTSPEYVNEQNLAFSALRSCYKCFTIGSDSKLKPCTDDMDTLKAIACEYKANGDKMDGKDFQPKSIAKFRKAFENFVSDRLTGRCGKTAEEIDAEREAKKAARRMARQAEKENKAKEEAKKAA